MTWDDLLSEENVVVRLESGHEVGLLAKEDEMGRRFIETRLLEGDAQSYYSQQPASGIGFRFGNYLLMKFVAMIEPIMPQKVSG